MQQKRKGYVYPTRIKNSNLGDVLINVLLIRELSKHGVVYLDGANPILEEHIFNKNTYSDNIKLIKGIKFFKGRPILRWINLIRILPCINFVFDPPGAYPDKSNGFKNWFKFLKYFLRCKVLKVLNINVVRFGVSIGPLSKTGMWRQKMLSKSYYLWGVRDLHNFNELQSIGFDNLVKIEDLAFLFNKDAFNINNKDELNTGKVCLSFRGSVHDNTIDEDYIARIKVFIDENVGFFRKMKVFFSYQVEEDKDVCWLLYTHLLSKGIESKVLSEKLNMSEALNLYSSVDFVFTNRLHVALLSLLTNTIAYAVTDVSKHKKLVNIYKDLSLQPLILDVSHSIVLDIENNTQNILSDFSRNKEEREQSLLSAFASKF